ncbi:hypothetical protein CC80DRAFT_542647 [Byssothecium circinans]|uniref:C3H1-type domain-containing protein n=1 Tax=Byssothecium circinans TaxID=147558 RepID=A0A6A5UDE4_9PLEO|nr:hypothetical protein CC80DRAFT_542647 [Byssothecium circinans]
MDAIADCPISYEELLAALTHECELRRQAEADLKEEREAHAATDQKLALAEEEVRGWRAEDVDAESLGEELANNLFVNNAEQQITIHALEQEEQRKKQAIESLTNAMGGMGFGEDQDLEERKRKKPRVAEKSVAQPYDHICPYWKAGRCRRGLDCTAGLHPGKQSDYAMSGKAGEVEKDTQMGGA